MHVHRRQLLCTANEIAGGRRGKDEPFPLSSFTLTCYFLDRRAARLGDRAEGFFHDVSQPSPLVSRSCVGAAIGPPASQIVVVPLHLTNQVAGHLFIGSSRGQEMDGITNFGDFRKQHGGSGTHQQIGRESYCRVASDSRESIAPSTLQSNHKVR